MSKQFNHYTTVATLDDKDSSLIASVHFLSIFYDLMSVVGYTFKTMK